MPLGVKIDDYSKNYKILIITGLQGLHRFICLDDVIVYSYCHSSHYYTESVDSYSTIPRRNLELL